MTEPSVRSNGTTAPPNVGWWTSGVHVPGVIVTPRADCAEEIAAHASTAVAAQVKRRFINKGNLPKRRLEISECKQVAKQARCRGTASPTGSFCWMQTDMSRNPK